MKKLIRFIIALFLCLTSGPFFLIILACIVFYIWLTQDNPDWNSFKDDVWKQSDVKQWLTFK